MKISVCIATYNGQQYIEAQLRSILAQLAVDDEVIIFDDNSSDSTVQVINQIQDLRIQLHRGDGNVGHVRNFERVLAKARGDIIFLSDQDDIWTPTKKHEIIERFEVDPNLIFLYHSLSTMNASGQLITQLWNPVRSGYPNRLFFLLRQIYRCQVFGCGTVFRRELLDILMPFPRAVYAHDHWLAVAAAVRGRVFLLNRPLVLYRQHINNLTPKKGLNWYRRLIVRIKLVVLVVIATVRRLRFRSVRQTIASDESIR